VLLISLRPARSWVLVLVCVLSLGVLLQILGTDISFWDFMGVGDVVESTQFDVVGVIPPLPSLTLLWSGSILFGILSALSSMMSHPIFRPPIDNR
jgi:hypothetical protein